MTSLKQYLKAETWAFESEFFQKSPCYSVIWMCGRKWLGPTQAGLSVFFGLEETCLSQLSCLLPYPSPAARVMVIRAWLCCVVRADMASGLQVLKGDDPLLGAQFSESASCRLGGAEKQASCPGACPSVVLSLYRLLHKAYFLPGRK